MEVESQTQEDQLTKNEVKNKKEDHIKKLLLFFNCFLLSIGNSGGPLIMRLYYLHGGKRIWLACWLETGGWPFMLIPLIISFIYRSSKGNNKTKTKAVSITPFLFAASAVLGVFTGLDDYFYAYGVKRLPVSTSALIISTQLAFTAGFAFVLVKQKFTAYSINAVVLLTVAAVVLGVNTSTDRPDKESAAEYYGGFFMTLGASALYGLILPLIELTYMKSKTKITYTLVVEMQMVMSFFATAFCTGGMLINKDFQAIPREARAYGLGEGTYYTVLVFSALFWQCFFLGAVGVIFSASSLFSGIMIAVLLPLTESLAVAFYHEKFGAEKGISLALSLWGFVSYFYGEFKLNKKPKQTVELVNDGLTPSS